MTDAGLEWLFEVAQGVGFVTDSEEAEVYISAFCKEVEKRANSDALWVYITWEEKVEAAFNQVKRELLGKE